MAEISIGGRRIGVNHRPFVIAEMSANHDGKIHRALDIIDAAKAAGADAVKMQTYTADTITLNSDQEDFTIRGGLWDGRTLHELYQQAYTPWDWHGELFNHARDAEIILFSSVFDNSAVDLLEDLNAPAYKIASFEAVDLPLIRYAAGTGKPMIISTGLANAYEISEAIEAARDGGCNEIAVLHCVSGYPAPASDYNLRTIPDMIQRFGLVTGLSDHTVDNATAVASVALGASIIEKHFTLDRNGGGPDDSFSLEPSELAALCRDAKTAWDSLGTANYGYKSSERGNIQFRRSLYFVKDLKKGDTITNENVRSIRPGYGLPPNRLSDIVGHTVNADVQAATAVSESIIAY